MRKARLFFITVLLCFAIVSGNIYFIAIAASLCLLSRYSLIGWIIPFLLILILQKKYKRSILFSLTGFVFFLVFFLIPFGFSPVRRLIRLPSGYVSFALGFGPTVLKYSGSTWGLLNFSDHIMQPPACNPVALQLYTAGVFVLFCLLQKKQKIK